MQVREGSDGSDEHGAWSPHLLLAVVTNPKRNFEHIVGYYSERLPDEDASSIENVQQVREIFI